MYLKKTREVFGMAFDKNFQTIVDWSIRILSPILLGMVGWVVSELGAINKNVSRNSERLVAIESNRYTTANALQDQQTLWDRLDGIKGSIAELERRIPTRTEFEAMSALIHSLRDDVRASRNSP